MLLPQSATKSGEFANLAAATLRKGQSASRMDALDALGVVEDRLSEAIEAAHQAVKLLQNEGVAGRQMEAYTIPWLRAWIEDENQPGSVAAIRRILQENDQDAAFRAEDEAGDRTASKKVAQSGVGLDAATQEVQPETQRVENSYQKAPNICLLSINSKKLTPVAEQPVTPGVQKTVKNKL